MKIFCAFLALFVFSGFAFCQTDKNVSAIRAEVESINKNAAKFRQTTGELNDVSTEGGKITVFRDNAQIKKIVAEIYGEMGRSILELYYKNEKLIFAFEREYRYERPFGKVLKIIPTRFYFTDERLVKMLVARREIFAEDAEYVSLRDRMIPLAKSVFEAAKAGAKSN